MICGKEESIKANEQKTTNLIFDKGEWNERKNKKREEEKYEVRLRLNFVEARNIVREKLKQKTYKWKEGKINRQKYVREKIKITELCNDK